jgi:hypothetical protein
VASRFAHQLQRENLRGIRRPERQSGEFSAAALRLRQPFTDRLCAVAVLSFRMSSGTLRTSSRGYMTARLTPHNGPWLMKLLPLPCGGRQRGDSARAIVIARCGNPRTRFPRDHPLVGIAGKSFATCSGPRQ